MPRRRKGAYLYLKAERRDRAGAVTHHATWIVRDGTKDVSTGCASDQVAEAERKLSEYLAVKHQPVRKEQDIEAIFIADVLAIYVDDCRDRQRNKSGFDQRIARLNDWWGDKRLSEVTGETCRGYQRARGNSGGARRDLEDLRAAINHHAKEGLHRGMVRVSLPQKGEPRDRWLTRHEAARLIWACWRYREIQTRHRGDDFGAMLPTSKRPLQHLARLILIGLYTGTRAASILAASPTSSPGRAHVDLDRGVFYRRPAGAPETKKRQPPVPLPPRLLAHLRRWVRCGAIQNYFVEFNGEPVASVKTGFKHAVDLAELHGKISPHTLRHTAATWLMQAGADRWQAAGYLGMTIEMLDRVYGHHHPDHLSGAVDAIGYGSRQIRSKPEQTEVVSGAVVGAVGKSRVRR